MADHKNFYSGKNTNLVLSLPRIANFPVRKKEFGVIFFVLSFVGMIKKQGKSGGNAQRLRGTKTRAIYYRVRKWYLGDFHGDTHQETYDGGVIQREVTF